VKKVSPGELEGDSGTREVRDGLAVQTFCDLAVLAAADVFTASTAAHAIQSIRLDLGYRSQVHP
jgi:hypothetical protein